MTQASSESETAERDIATTDETLVADVVQVEDHEYVVVDGILTRLVQSANTGAIRVPLTLQMKGILVSGVLVSAHEFFEGSGQTIKQWGEGEIIDWLANEIFGSDGLVDSSEVLANIPNHIHLADTKFFIPGNRPTPVNKGTFWRGKLSEVDGFTLGTLGGVDKVPDPQSD